MGLPRRYVLGRRLGSGGFGQVYAAVDQSSGEEVAIKFFAPFVLDADVDAVKAAGVEHPNVVPVLATGRHDGTPYLVMPLVRGRTLADHLEEGALSPREAVELLAGIAGALDAVHRNGLVHGDVKPSNIMLTEQPSSRAVLLDFGQGATTKADRAGSFVGTPAYAAPEHLRRGSVTPAADIYALAAVLAECLTATRAFSGPTHEETARAHVRRQGPLIDTDHPAARALAPVLEKGLDLDPRRRFGTASELVDAARGALRGLSPDLMDKPLSSRRSAEGPAPTTVRD